MRNLTLRRRPNALAASTDGVGAPFVRRAWTCALENRASALAVALSADRFVSYIDSDHGIGHQRRRSKRAPIPHLVHRLIHVSPPEGPCPRDILLFVSTSPTEELDRLWRMALAEIELVVSRAHFSTWFKHASVAQREGDLAVIAVSNIFTREWLENKYHDVILTALQHADPAVRRIRCEVQTKGSLPTSHVIPGVAILQKRVVESPAESTGQNSPPSDTAFSPTIPQWDAASNLNARYNFETFVVGAHNELAHACAQAVARRPGDAYNPLFIYGGVGLGKTHLLQAIGNALQARGTLRVRYVSSEKFMHELVTAIQTKVQRTFRERYRNTVDVLIIDDVQFLAGKEKTQDELFHTFNELHGSGKQLVFSSDRPPKAIAALEERLRSRFEGGMVADVGAPDLETRIAILKAKCALRRLSVAEDILAFIAAQVSNNVRELEGCLNRVLAYCELQGLTPTLEQTKEVLAGFFAPPKRMVVHTDRILEAVCAHFHLNIEVLTGKSRRKNVVLPRQVAMFLLRSENQFSFPAIGSIFGGRDHTTAMHACEKVGENLERDEILRQNVLAIRQKLYVSAERV